MKSNRPNTDAPEIGLAPMKDGSLYYEKRGSGAPVFLLHPGYSDARVWDPQFNVLSETHAVVRYDQRGSGRSSVPVAEFSHVEDLRQMMDYLGVERAHLVGHSVGSQIVIDFCLQYPAKVRSLVLVSPAVSGYVYSDAFMNWIRSVYSDFTADGIAERTLASDACSVAMADPLVARRLRILTRHNTAKLLTWQSNELSWPCPDAVARIAHLKTPTLALVGERDHADTHKIAELLAASGPRVTYEKLTESDHFPNLVAPDFFNQRILSFFDSIAD